jgi:hypothetical protein
VTTIAVAHLASTEKRELVRASWIDLIKYYGLSDTYTRPKLVRAAGFWDADPEEWATAGWAAHREYWASVDAPCGLQDCPYH